MVVVNVWVVLAGVERTLEVIVVVSVVEVVSVIGGRVVVTAGAVETTFVVTEKYSTTPVQETYATAVSRGYLGLNSSNGETCLERQMPIELSYEFSRVEHMVKGFKNKTYCLWIDIRRCRHGSRRAGYSSGIACLSGANRTAIRVLFRVPTINGAFLGVPRAWFGVSTVNNGALLGVSRAKLRILITIEYLSGGCRRKSGWCWNSIRWRGRGSLRDCTLDGSKDRVRYEE